MPSHHPDARSSTHGWDMPTHYTILVGASVGSAWHDWFDGLSITEFPDGTSAIAGTVVDQAMLFGLLIRVRDLGLPLLALQREDDGGRLAALRPLAGTNS